MAKCGKEILLGREGTEQQQRFLDALNPDSVKLNDFGLEEWMKFAYRFAKQVNYFDLNNFETPSGNWKAFFKKGKGLEKLLKDVESENNITPHLALFVSFISLLELTKSRFNKLTKRHLDFYYKNILQIEKLPATPDQVHLIFELAKSSLQAQIAKETELDGGKDVLGKKLIYKTSDELIANKVKVAQLKSVYNDLKNNKLKAAEVANSYDGIGGKFPSNDIKWWPFGYFEEQDSDSLADGSNPMTANGDTEYNELSDAKIGFAASSKVLELQEGLRNIQVTIDFSTNLESLIIGALHTIEVHCSGEKRWLGPFTVQSEVKDAEEDRTIFSSGLSNGNKTLKLAFQIPKDEDALVDYDSEMLGEYFNSKLPVCRFLIKTETEKGYSLYQNMVQKEVENITINVSVEGVKSLNLESDIGTLNAEKPFYPFSTQPVRKSNFYIDYPELFKKDWNELTINLEWKNTPVKPDGTLTDAFKDLYYAYRKDYLFKANSNKFLKGMFLFEEIKLPNLSNLNPPVVEKFDSNATAKLQQNTSENSNLKQFAFTELIIEPSNLIVDDNEHFKGTIEIKNKEEWIKVEDSLNLFIEDVDGFFETEFSISNNEYEINKNGPVRLSLNQPFYHELFPRIYALAFSSIKEEALIPNEPYTPFVESIRLNYTAESKITLNSEKTKYEENELRLFHEHPFGQAEEHPYLKFKTGFLFPDKNEGQPIPTNLIPTYCKGGELYIGLKNAEQLQQVSLLVQVLEGSENPLVESFTGKQKVEWSVLANNQWKDLNSDYMISNETDNFLKSGIVSFSIPGDASVSNSILPPELIWVRAKIHKDYNAVCKTIDILAQAVLSEFSDNENDLAHLKKGLEAKTISKMVQRIAKVKSVSQPFNSFGGKPQESDEAFYRRISERLRHKNRAISLWDYEHIILQQFPEIHKVKCLNHSKVVTQTDKKNTYYFLSPGNVLLVVIPDIVNKNVFDIYQPRVSKATLNAVYNWVNELNTLHVDAQVINPEYEEVKVSLRVRFHKGYDESFYRKVLNKDITKLLSPWAFEDSASIDFGIILHRSTVINYIEKLEYVDYMEDVTLIKDEESSISNVAPSNPAAILVSVKEHEILPVEIKCNGTKEIEEICQT